MKFHFNHDPANKTLTIPRAALQFSGLADVSDLILHTDSGCVLLLPGDPTVAELLKTISLLSTVTPQLISRLAERSQMAMEAGMTETACGSGYSYYTIKATAGAGGSISPSGNASVREGRDQTFTITPDKGYAVANVKIDGKSIGAAKSYTFENVSRTHTIEVIFMKANGNPRTGVFVDVATGSYYEDAVDCAVLFSLQETN